MWSLILLLGSPVTAFLHLLVTRPCILSPASIPASNTLLGTEAMVERLMVLGMARFLLREILPSVPTLSLNSWLCASIMWNT